MTDIAHFNMVEQHIRPWNVHSPALLEAISRLERSLFVPDDQQVQCYFDTCIPLGDMTYMLAPKVAARMVQALEVQPEDTVLLVGAGSGYTAALCASLARAVVCYDDDQAARERAAKNCAAAGIENIEFRAADLSKSAEGKLEYDAILIREGRSAAAQEFIEKLSENGRCVTLVGDERIMELMRFTREGKNIQQESLIDILTPELDPLVDTAEQRVGFVF